LDLRWDESYKIKIRIAFVAGDNAGEVKFGATLDSNWIRFTNDKGRILFIFLMSIVRRRTRTKSYRNKIWWAILPKEHIILLPGNEK